MDKTILLIDDDEDFGMLTARMLEMAGCTVTRAADADEGQAMACKAPPAMIVMDFNFPAGGGETMYQRLRAAAPTAGLPILFLTAVPKELVAVAVPPDPHVFFLAKPFKKPELLAAVGQILSGDTDKNLLLSTPETTP